MKVINMSQKATRAHTRAHNKRLVLKTIYDHDHPSRADVARATSLTRASISNVVAELIEEGLVIEVGVGSKSIGKPPTLLSVEPNAGHVVSLDLAGTEFRGALLNLRGEIVEETSRHLGERHGQEAVELVVEIVDSLIEGATRPLLGIGIGTPGVVDPTRGIINSINLNWVDLPLGKILQDRFSLPVHLANDAQVGALAQYLFGEAKGLKNLILVKVGRGIGAGIVLGGQIFYGDGYGAGEIGHVVVAPDGKLCTCGHFGCLETMAGSRALGEHVTQLAMAKRGSFLHNHISDGHALDIDVILKAFRNGDMGLGPVIERSGRFLGMAMAHLIGALNIRHIFIAGEMARFGDALLEPIRAEVLRCALPALAAQLEIHITDLSTNIVTLGAGALVLHHELGLV